MWVCFGGDLAVGLAPVLVMLDLLAVVSGDFAGIAAEFVVVGTVAAETVAAETEMAADTGIVEFVAVDLDHIAIYNA